MIDDDDNGIRRSERDAPIVPRKVETATAVLYVRIRPSHLRDLRHRARTEGRTVSDVVRRAIRREITGDTA